MQKYPHPKWITNTIGFGSQCFIISPVNVSRSKRIDCKKAIAIDSFSGGIVPASTTLMDRRLLTSKPFPFYSIVKYCFACKRHLYPSWGKLELMGWVTPPPHYRRVGRDSRFWSLGNDWIWWINLLFYAYDSIRHVMYRAATWRLLSYKNSLTNP